MPAGLRHQRRLHFRRQILIAAAAGIGLSARHAGAMTFNLTFDSTVTSLPYAAQAETATSYAAQTIASLFSDNITININVVANDQTFGSSGHGLAGAFSYSTVRSDLIASSSTSNDSTAYATLPSSPDPTNGGTFFIPGVELKGLGLAPGNTLTNDGTFAFGNNVPWTFDPNNRAVPGDYDFIGVAEHELTEVMGRNQGLNENGYFVPIDLFRYKGAGVRSTDANDSNAYFSIDGGVTELMDDPQGGEGDWAAGVTDSFDAASVQGTENDISPTDIAVLDVMGFHAITPHILNRTNAVSNSWSSATAWNPGHVPAAGDGAYITYNSNSSHSVTYDYTGPAVSLFSLEIDQTSTNNATATLVMNGNNLTTSSYEIIGERGIGILTQSAGVNTISSLNGLFIGNKTGSTGTYNLSGTGSLIVHGDEKIGVDGTGIFNHSAGTNTVDSSFSIYLGQNTNGVGIYNLSGGTVSAGTLYAGNDGAGTFNQSAGVATFGSAQLAANANSHGNYTLSGGTLNLSYFGVGQVGTGTFTQTGGILSSSDHYSIGDNPSGVGTFNIAGTANITANSAYIAFQGTGTLNQSAGSNTLLTYMTIADQPGSAGVYNLSGGTLSVPYFGVGQNGAGTLNQSGGNITVTDHISVGDSGTGTYSLSAGTINTNYAYDGYLGIGHYFQSGGTFTTPNFLSLADQGGSSGTYSLSANGILSVTSGGGEFIGNAGAGTFTQSGGTNTAGTMYIANEAGSTGSYSMSAGVLSLTNAYVGGGDHGAEGAGSLTISGGSATISQTLTVYVQTGTPLTLSGGTLSVGTLNLNSTPRLLNWTAGRLVFTNTPTITLNASGPFATSLTLSSTKILAAPGSNLVIPASSTLNLTGTSLSAGTLTINGTGAGSGALFVASGANTFTGSLSFAASSLARVASGASITLTSPFNWTNGTFGGDGTIIAAAGVTVSNSVTKNGTALLKVVGSLTVNTGAKLDAGAGDLLIDYTGSSPAATIRGYLKTGYNTGNWNGTGIASTMAQNDSTHLTSLGYAEAADVGITTFDGLSVDSTTLLVKYTYYGDSSLDGKVDLGNDFNLFLQGYLNHGSTWELGDYNYDGQVTTADFDLFIDGYKSQSGNLGDLNEVIASSPELTTAQRAELIAAVPEPTSLGWLASATCLFAARRRRK